MKLTGIFLLAAVLHLSAGTMAQTVTYAVKDAPLTQVFTAIEKQTGCVFFYSKQDLQRAKPVTVNLQGVFLQEAMETILADQPLTFNIQGNTIAITLKEHAVAQTAIAPVPPGEIHGRITNVQGEPLVNANVMIKRSKKGTTTNVKGEFVLTNVRPDDVISISFIGYKTKSFKISDPHDGAGYDQVMQVADNELDQVVIQAYGVTSKRFSTGDISVVTAKEIERQPVMNPILTLQGRVAGLEVQQINGYASAPVQAEIRGRATIGDAASEPLYIIDGVPLMVLRIGTTQGYGPGTGFLQNAGLTGPAAGQSPLFSINPKDIESIEVLKDADATSIYGSRGANGVILITTKKGKIGKTKLDMSVNTGFTAVTRYWKMLNTPQYLSMRREAFRNDAIIPDPGSAPDLLTWDTTRYIDWQKELYGHKGQVINTEMRVSGGDYRTTFSIGATYSRMQAITTASGADLRGGLSLNLSHSSVNRKVTLSLSASYNFTRSDMISLPGSVTFAPNAPGIYDSVGKLNWKEWEPAGGNPFNALLDPYTAKTNFLNSNLGLSYQPVRGLTAKISFGYNNSQVNQVSLEPIASQNPATHPTGSAFFGNNSNHNWIIEPQLSYEAVIGPGKFTALIGGSAQGTVTDGIYIHGMGYTSDALLRTISNAPNKETQDNYAEYRYASVFARAGYNLFDRYVINLNARRDGSSNYGPGHQFGNFASVGWAWLFTEEPWFKNHTGWLSFGKFRGSYGIAGSDGGIPYGYITRWKSSKAIYDGITPLVAIQHANPNYRWQQNTKLEFAADLGFFKDWLTLTVAYYRNRTGNQLLAYPTPLMSGFTSVIANLNALVQNAGWEFSIGGKGVHVHSKYFNWDWAPRFTFSINQNKFLSFDGLGSSPFRNQGLIGHPLNGRYLLHYIGIDPQTGNYTYEDKNHDGIINPNTGPTTDGYFKKTSPTYSTGFGFNFDAMGFGISLFFLAKKQTGINAIAQGVNPGAFNYNQPVEVLGRWQKPGDIANVGKFSTINAQDPGGYLGSSDIGYTDASYIRLQNVSLTYSLPEKWTKKSHIQSSVFVNANNILTITGYKGIDPETQNFGGMPPTRTIVAGLTLTL